MTAVASPVVASSQGLALPRAPRALLAAAIFVPQMIAGIYRGLGAELPDLLPILSTMLLALGVVAWFRSYCSAFRITQPMDMGWFLLIAWPLVVPYFIISREGRRGLRRIGSFVVGWVIAALLGALIGLSVASISGNLERSEDQESTRAA